MKKHRPQQTTDAIESEVYFSQVRSLLDGASEFENTLKSIHSIYNNGEMAEWPLVLLSTIELTTIASLAKLLPDPKDSNDAIDRRSIATLIRNLVDTHDVIDFLFGCSSPEEYNLHRDILGYYLAGRTQAVQNSIFGESQSHLKHSKEFYWKAICLKLDKARQAKIKSSESIFYTSRTERIEKVAGNHAKFIKGILADISTYVHSIPPALWFSDIAEGFDNSPENREILAVWIQICNYYIARTISMISNAASIQLSGGGQRFVLRHQNLFSPSSIHHQD